MLSPKVKEELLEAQSHLRAALKNAAVNEKPFMCKHIADMIMQIDNLEKTEELLDKLENRKSGDSGMFGQFFTDLGN
jgi:hypothetical protein